MVKIDDELLGNLTIDALDRQFQQMDYSLFDSCDSQTNIKIRVLLPTAPIPIRRNRKSDEAYVLIRGKLFVVLYNEMGGQTERLLLDESKGSYGVKIPRDQWFSIEVVEPSTILEIKNGDTEKIDENDIMY